MPAADQESGWARLIGSRIGPGKQYESQADLARYLVQTGGLQGYSDKSLVQLINQWLGSPGGKPGTRPQGGIDREFEIAGRLGIPKAEVVKYLIGGSAKVGPNEDYDRGARWTQSRRSPKKTAPPAGDAGPSSFAPADVIVWLAQQLGIDKEQLSQALDLHAGHLDAVTEQLAQAEARIASLETELAEARDAAQDQVGELEKELAALRKRTPEDFLVETLHMSRELAPRFLPGDAADPETQRRAWEALLPAFQGMTNSRPPAS